MSENTSSSSYEILAQSSDEWIAECFNDAEMNCSPDDLYASLIHFISSSNSFNHLYNNLMDLWLEIKEFLWGIRTAN